MERLELLAETGSRRRSGGEGEGQASKPQATPDALLRPRAGDPSSSCRGTAGREFVPSAAVGGGTDRRAGARVHGCEGGCGGRRAAQGIAELLLIVPQHQGRLGYSGAFTEPRTSRSRPPARQGCGGGCAGRTIAGGRTKKEFACRGRAVVRSLHPYARGKGSNCHPRTAILVFWRCKYMLSKALRRCQISRMSRRASNLDRPSRRSPSSSGGGRPAPPRPFSALHVR